MASPTWKEIEQHPEYVGLDDDGKSKVKNTFFSRFVEPHPEFGRLSDQEKENVKLKFLAQGTRPTLGDYGRSLGIGLDRFGQMLGRGLDVMGADKIGKGIEETYKTREEKLRGELTPAFKVEQAKRYTDTDENGNFKFGEAWTSVPKILGSALESAPSTVVGMAGGFGVTKLLIPAFKKIGLSSGLAGIVGGAVGEGGMGGADSAKEAYDMVMKADIKNLSQSDEFVKAYGSIPVESKLTDAEKVQLAREMVAKDTALKSGAIVGAATAVLGAPSGHFLGKAIGGEAGKTMARTIFKQGALELGQEAPQSAAEKLTANVFERRYSDPTLPISKDVLESAVEGGISGGIMGGALGKFSHDASVSAKANKPGIDLGGEAGGGKPEPVEGLSPKEQESYDNTYARAMEMPSEDLMAIKAQADERLQADPTDRATVLAKKVAEDILNKRVSDDMQAQSEAAMKESEPVEQTVQRWEQSIESNPMGDDTAAQDIINKVAYGQPFSTTQRGEGAEQFKADLLQSDLLEAERATSPEQLQPPPPRLDTDASQVPAEGVRTIPQVVGLPADGLQAAVEEPQKAQVKTSDDELISRYSPGNPFAAKAAKARKKADLFSRPTAREAAMAEHFPVGVGGSGPNRQNTDKQIDASVKRASEAVNARKYAEYLEGQAKSFDEGKINAQGRRLNPGLIARSEKREALKQRNDERIAAARTAREGKEQHEVTGDVWATSSGFLGGQGRQLVISEHKEAVGKALSEDKPVPPEVIADYPDLAEKYAPPGLSKKPTMEKPGEVAAGKGDATEAVNIGQLKRGKPKNTVVFQKPISGNGAEVTSYSWSSKGGLRFDKREGGDVETLVSDWDQSILNPETGKKIVHKFLVKKQDGSQVEVSVDSAAEILGVSKSTLINSAKWEENRRLITELNKLRKALVSKYYKGVRGARRYTEKGDVARRVKEILGDKRYTIDGDDLVKPTDRELSLWANKHGQEAYEILRSNISELQGGEANEETKTQGQRQADETGGQAQGEVLKSVKEETPNVPPAEAGGGKPETKLEKSLREYQTLVAGLSEGQREQVKDIIPETGNPKSPGIASVRIQKRLARLKAPSVVTKEAPRVETKAEPAKDQRKVLAVKKLRAVSAKLKEDGISKRDQDRQTNTHKRAGEAASAIASANRDIAISETMGRVADAIESEEAKHLSNISAKTQVEMLDEALRVAHGRMQAKKYDSYSEQQRHKDEPITDEALAFVKYPRVSVASGLANSLRNDLEKHKGGAKLARKVRGEILPFEDAEEIVAFAKKNGFEKMLPWTIDGNLKKIRRLKALGIENENDYRAALGEYLGLRSGAKKEDPIKALEREIQNTKGIGVDFFPTPKDLAKRLVETADIKPGMKVLEPSAGKGDIAEAVKSSEPEAVIDTVEMSMKLSGLLKLKGFNVVGSDFMDHSGQYDRIVMNPPFSKGMDVDHVRHAYELLKPGGRIVAIMGEHPFFANDKKSVEFREWLDEVGESEKLPAGSFTGRDAFNQTGVNSRMVTIDKPIEKETPSVDGKKAKTPTIAKGKTDIAYTSDNSPIEFQYAVVDLSDLVVSHDVEFHTNEAFPKELQPRNRDRKAMVDIVESIANKWNPARVAASSTVSSGAPIVGQDLVVEAGNGRMIALRKVYNRGGDAEYRKFLYDNAGDFGISSKQIDAAKEPVLVRIRQTDVDRVSFAKEGNNRDTAEMSPMEQAISDAEVISDSDMSTFRTSEDGTVSPHVNKSFIINFFQKIGKNQSSGMMTEDGRVNQKGLERIQAAVFAKAYADQNLIALNIEETNPEIRSILNALDIAAGTFAQAKATSPAFKDLDITKDIVAASKIIRRSRAEGVSIDQVINQRSMFDKAWSKETIKLAKFFDKNIRSGKATIGKGLKRMAELIKKDLQSRSQTTMFGKEAPATKTGVIQGGIDYVSKSDAPRQGDLFGGNVGEGDRRNQQGKPGQPETGNAGQRLTPSNLPLSANFFNHPPTAFDGYGWRSMSKAEYDKLISGDKTYGGKAAGKGNFVAPTPDSASQYATDGKYLVEFGGVKKAEGETVSNEIGRDNITRAMVFRGGEWVDVDLGKTKETDKGTALYSVDNARQKSENSGMTSQKGPGDIATSQNPDGPVGGNPFKESVVQDIVYHANKSKSVDFESLRRNKKGMIFFSEGEDYAKDFGPNITQAVINIKNPLDLTSFDAEQTVSPDEITEFLSEKGVSVGQKDIFRDVDDDGEAIGGEILQHVSQAPNRGGIAKAAKASGYDGIILNEYVYGVGSSKTYVVFSPDQIKTTPNQPNSPAEGEQYSFSPLSPQSGITLKDVRDMFPRQTVSDSGDGKFKIKGEVGSPITVEMVNHISIDEGAFEISYQRPPTADEKARGAAGSYQNGVIKISRIGDRWTLAHESYHFLEESGFISPADRFILDMAVRRNGAKPSEEARAKYVEDMRFKRDTVSGRLGKIIQKVADLIDGFVNLFQRTARGVLRDIESGKIYSKSLPKTTKDGVEINYLEPDEMGSAFGFFDGENIYVRNDLPQAVARFVAEHEGQHKKDGIETGHWITQEIRASLFPGIKDPVGLVKTIFASLSKDRLNFYKNRFENGGSSEISYQQIADKWRSQMQSVLEKKLPGKSGGKAMAAMIEGWAKKGEFKAEELSWSGLGDWLRAQDGVVSKPMVLTWLEENNIRVGEVVKGSKYDAEDEFYDELAGTTTSPEQQRTDTKFSQYQTPGGTGYKEMLLTLPPKPADSTGWTAKQESDGTWLVSDKDGKRVGSSYRAKSESEAIQHIAEDKGAYENNYESPHWDEPNVLAHVRFNERPGPNGERVLVVIENQSDWHQEGRKKGYSGTIIDDMLKKYPSLPRNPDEWTGPELHNFLTADEMSNVIDHFNGDAYGIPDAPFKKSWPMLVMKRMVRYAAENGFDVLAWENGETQADRYPREEGSTEKEAQLKGMVGFYDQILPAEVNKMFNKSEWGRAKVTQIQLPDSGAPVDIVEKTRRPEQYAASRTPTVWSIPITPEMRHKALYEGMPMYAAENDRNNPKSKLDEFLAGMPDDIKKESKASVDRIKAGGPDHDEMIRDARDLIQKAKGAHGFGVTDKDMKWWNRAFEVPYVLAKKFPNSMGKLMKTELDSAETRSTLLEKDYAEKLGDIQDKFKTDKKAQQELQDLIWKYEGKRFDKKDVPTDWFSEDENGDLQINPEHYDEVRAVLKKEGVSQKAIDGFIAIREKLDEKWIDAFYTMKTDKMDPTLIEEFRGALDKIHNYFPHRRAGNIQISIFDREEKKVVHSRHFYNLTGKDYLKINERQAGKSADWLKAAIDSGELPGPVSRYRILQPQKLTRLPQEAFFQINMEGMQQVLGVAGEELSKSRVEYEAERLYNKEGRTMEEAMELARQRLTADMEKALSKATADVFKSQGWGSHAINRKGTPGFIEDDIFGTLFEYLSGYAGFKTKMQRAREHSKVLVELDAKANPNEYKYSAQYVKDMLENQDLTDRVVDMVRGAFFVKYLGFVVKSGLVNLTQNVVMAGPVLSMHTKGSHRKIGKAMMDTMRALTSKAAWTGKEINFSNLSKNEQSALHELTEKGATTDQYLRELKGNIPGVGWGRHVKKVIGVSGIFMQLAERFNRASTGLAAYRIGVEKGMNHDSAVEFAKGIVYDSHFIYGKHNLPSFARGSAKALRAAYTFRSFTHNYVDMMHNMIANQGAPGRKAAARSLVNLISIGGLSAFPFIGLLGKALMAAIGDDDDDFMTWAREKATTPFTKDLISHGLIGAATGADITGSIAIEVPAKWTDILGVPSSVAEDTINTIKSLKSGQVYRAISETPITPMVMKNAMRAVELATTGQRARSGKDINYPGEEGARKITGGEAALKGLIGLQPLSVSKGYSAYEANRLMKESISEKKSRWADRYANAERRGDATEKAKVMDEVKAWNQKAKADGKGYKVVDIKKMVKSRLDDDSMKGIPKAMRGRAKDIAGQWR